MVAEPRSLNFETSEVWLRFESEAEIKFAELRSRATLGSSSSNSIPIADKKLKPLHGQFIRDRYEIRYRDFEINEVRVVGEGQTFEILDWKIRWGSWKEIQKDFEQKFLESFKSLLKGRGLDALETAWLEFQDRWFINSEIPESLRTVLASQLDQLSLFSPIETLLEDSEVTDILVESFDCIWIEKSGELRPSNLRFLNAETYEIYLENLLTKLHKSVDEVRPYLDFVLSDGSRGHLIAPPLTERARYLSIRKKRKVHFSLQDLVDHKMVSSETFSVLKKALVERKNILISGATGSGKTTLLKAFLLEVPAHERMIVIEDTSELKIERENAAFLYSRLETLGGFPPVSLRDLVRQSLRMRPDRIIIGEVRGEEALDLMHAMNTGHRGCMGSLHANSARDALLRLQGLIQMSSASLSESAMRDLIARNIQVLVHCGRSSDGLRKIVEYAFVRGVDQNQILLELHSC
jgi:pilus assembly protein CpaF